MITDLRKKTDHRIKHKKCLHAKVVRTQYWDSKKAEYVDTYHCTKCHEIVDGQDVTLFRFSKDEVPI